MAVINPIVDFQPTAWNSQSVVGAANTGDDAFGDIFKAAMNLVNETNQYQIDADRAQINYATGQDDNMLTVLLAQEKAYSSLNFTVQVTNKIIESYREIMRMQI